MEVSPYIVSKPLIGLTTLNQALIRTPTPNLMGVIRSKSMISKAFQACYSIEGCLSDRCILSHERVEYSRKQSLTQPLTKITPYTLKRITLTTSRASEMKTRAKKALPVRGPLTHDSGVPLVTSQHNFIVQPLVTKEWNARTF